jgi:hypothetical protein
MTTAHIGLSATSAWAIATLCIAATLTLLLTLLSLPFFCPLVVDLFLFVVFFWKR